MSRRGNCYDWRRCEEIRSRRTTPVLRVAIANRKANQKVVGRNDSKDIWLRKLRCGCSASFRKNRWHKNKAKEWSYGYQCYNQLNNGTAKKRREAGFDDTGYCDMPMIADWKLEVMSKKLLERLWVSEKKMFSWLAKSSRNAIRPQRQDIRIPL